MRARSHLRSTALAACAAAVIACGGAAPQVEGAVYWGGGKIGAADLDGSDAMPDYFQAPGPADSSGPACGVAVSASHLYWAGGFGIGRVNFEGTATPSTVVPGLSTPCAIAVDDTYLYWTNKKSGAVGRARLDGGERTDSFISGLAEPCGVAVDGGHVYWAGWDGIGRANLDGSDPQSGLVASTANPCGLAVDGGHIYWGDRSNRSIGRADLSGGNPDPDFIVGLGEVWSIAVDSTHLFWTDRPEGMLFASIGRASLDGAGVDRRWVVGSSFDLYGVAVDARPSPPPILLPSNPIRFGKLRRNLNWGQMAMDVWVPERGELRVVWPKVGWKVVKGPEPPPARGGAFRWRLKLWPGKHRRIGRRIRRQLRRRGRAPITLRVRYNEYGHLPIGAVKRLAFRKLVPRRARHRR